MCLVVAVSSKPLSTMSVSSNDAHVTGSDDGDDDYNVDGEDDDDSDDSGDDDFDCSDSDDSTVKRNKKKAESKSGRGCSQAQKKTDANKPTPAAGTKRIYLPYC